MFNKLLKLQPVKEQQSQGTALNEYQYGAVLLHADTTPHLKITVKFSNTYKFKGLSFSAWRVTELKAVRQ